MPFYVFLDEVQVYDGAASGNLAALLEQTAKYGIKGFLLNQNPERLTKDTLNALTTNRSHLIATALNAHAASLITREWDGDPPASAITSLPRRTFLAQVTHRGQLTRPFLFANESVEEHFADAFNPEAVADIQPTIDTASGRTPAAATVEALDTLDERIKYHLLNTTRSGSSGSRGRHGWSLDCTAPARFRRAPGENARAHYLGAAACRGGRYGEPLPAPAAQTEQLRVLHTPDATAGWMRRVLRLLAERGLVDRVRGPATRSLWYLTELGADTIEAAGTLAEPRRRVTTSAQAAGPLRAHTIAVNDVGIAFVRAARKHGDECGPDSWRHEIAHPISRSRGRRPAELVVADALLSYLQVGEGGGLTLHQRFVELDRGTARPAEHLASKITRYARLRHYAASPGFHRFTCKATLAQLLPLVPAPADRVRRPVTRTDTKPDTSHARPA